MEAWLLAPGAVAVEAPRHWHSLKFEQPCLPEEIDQPDAKKPREDRRPWAFSQA